MTVEAARPQSWGVARLSFGMPKNVGRDAFTEQARLKEQAAKEQESNAKFIKAK